VNGGTWQWGEPTSGPAAAHEGSKVIATVLGGSYGENTASRLVSPELVVPAASENPRLRFWQWFSFSCGDYGEVQIKAAGGEWQQLVRFNGYSGGTWAYPALDLSAYGGQMVQLGFYFSSTSSSCGHTVSAGWYIDELEVVTGLTPALLPNVVEGFEAEGFWDNWSVNGGTWQWGEPTSGPAAAHEGSKVIATVLGGNYGENTASRLVSPELVVPAASENPRLRFWQWFSFSCGDYGEVQIKAAGGEWQQLVRFNGHSGGTWAYPALNLNEYAEQTVQLGFYFSSTSSSCGHTVSAGWYIDELEVVAQ
jgi:bacillopeptidase F (M6 metalloprotease family)